MLGAGATAFQVCNQTGTASQVVSNGYWLFQIRVRVSGGFWRFLGPCSGRVAPLLCHPGIMVDQGLNFNTCSTNSKGQRGLAGSPKQAPPEGEGKTGDKATTCLWVHVQGTDAAGNTSPPTNVTFMVRPSSLGFFAVSGVSFFYP